MGTHKQVSGRGVPSAMISPVFWAVLSPKLKHMPAHTIQPNSPLHQRTGCKKGFKWKTIHVSILRLLHNERRLYVENVSHQLTVEQGHFVWRSRRGRPGYSAWSYYELRNARHTVTHVLALPQKKCDGWLISLLFHSFVLGGFRQCDHVSPLWETAFVPIPDWAEVWQGVTVTMPCVKHPYEHRSLQSQRQHNWRVSLMVCIDGVDGTPRGPSHYPRL